jgi:hypothetical protein
LRQWAAQRAFQQDHTEVEEARMKKLASLYERENVLDLMKCVCDWKNAIKMLLTRLAFRCRLRNPRTFLATPSEVRELMDSIEKEAAEVSEELALLSGGDMPAGNGALVFQLLQ